MSRRGKGSLQLAVDSVAKGTELFKKGEFEVLNSKRKKSRAHISLRVGAWMDQVVVVGLWSS